MYNVTSKRVHGIVAVEEQIITYCEWVFVAFFALEYAIRRVQVSQDGWKLIGTHQLLVYADVNVLGGSIHGIKKNTEPLVVTSQETGKGVNPDKTKYMVMSRDQNAGRSHIINIDNSSFERVNSSII